MTVSRFLDKFDRADGAIGDKYTVACGVAEILDETVFPVDADAAGGSPALDGTTEQKTQVFYTENEFDRSDYSVRAVWFHLDSFIGVSSLTAETTNDPSFTLLARMTKDPMLVDLGGEEQPLCYDQGYGLRVTCPRDGTAPVIKIIKYLPTVLPPGIASPSSSEVDGAFVLASKTLKAENLATDPDWDGTGNIQYQGFYQAMRLRVRRVDDRVVLDGYLNDRNQHTPILTVEDIRQPLWGQVGVPGFEFISAAKTAQSGTSPFNLEAVALMGCYLFETETVIDIAPARTQLPANLWTYDKCAQEAILIVEKQGDAKYTSSLNGTTKLNVFRNFVYLAEKEILRREGYYRFLQRTAQVHMKGGERFYELPENCGEVISIVPGNWSGAPLSELEVTQFSRSLAGFTTGTGRPMVYRHTEPGANLRERIEVFPTPVLDDTGADDNPLYVLVMYYARHLEPVDPARQVPFIPQEGIDALIWKAAADALMLDTDGENADRVLAQAETRIKSLTRMNNRKHGARQTVMRSAADVLQPDAHHRIPQLRATQLQNLFL